MSSKAVFPTALILAFASAGAQTGFDGAVMKNVTISSCGKSACFVIESPKAEQGVLGPAILKSVKLTLYPPRTELAPGKRPVPLEVLEGSEGYYDAALQSLVIKEPKGKGKASAPISTFKEVMLDMKDGSVVRF